MTDKLIIISYTEYARFSVLKWNPEKNNYIEMKRSVLKTIGSTRAYFISTMKKSKYVKLQFFCVIKRDLIRVQLNDIAVIKLNGHLHPKEMLYRGESDVIDYEQIDQIYIAILFKDYISIIDQFTQSILCTYKFQIPVRCVVLSPHFEVGNLPLVAILD